MDQSQEEWPVGSPAWQQHQEETLQASIAEIPPIFVDPAPIDPTEPPKPGTTYKWTQEDSWPLVAKRFGVTRQELLDHNGIEDPDAIKPGDSIHLPIAQPVPRDMTITFEVLPEPLPMHVKKEGGCKKWAFGNMRKWEDAKSAGFFPVDTNITIVAIAHVPIEEKDGSEAEAAYYMDAAALGDYPNGTVKWLIGYIWSDLAEGHIDLSVKPKPKQVAQLKIREQKAKEIAKKSVDIAAKTPATSYLDGFDRSFVEKRLADTLRDGDAHRFKRSYQPLNPHVPCTAQIPKSMGKIDDNTGKRFIIVHDFDTKRPDRKLYDLAEITVAGTFEYDGIIYGRPEKAAENYVWYGVDMSLLQADDDLYNTKLDASTRAAEGRQLTWSEQYIWVPLAKMSAHPLFEKRRQRKQKIQTNRGK